MADRDIEQDEQVVTIQPDSVKHGHTTEEKE